MYVLKDSSYGKCEKFCKIFCEQSRVSHARTAHRSPKQESTRAASIRPPAPPPIGVEPSPSNGWRHPSRPSRGSRSHLTPRSSSPASILFPISSNVATKRLRANEKRKEKIPNPAIPSSPRRRCPGAARAARAWARAARSVTGRCSATTSRASRSLRSGGWRGGVA